MPARGNHCTAGALITGVSHFFPTGPVPELPEVERAVQLLREALEGRTLTHVATHHPSFARTLPAATAQSLRGAQVDRVERRAKYQLAHLADGRTIAVHFKMTGDWAIGPADLPPPALTRAELLTDDGTRIALVDGRAFAVLRVHPPGDTILPPLGLEPLDPAWSGAQLAAALTGKRGSIKPALLDQRVVAGLGNIYSAEALWEARVHPAARVGRLSRPRVERIAAAARAVLERAPRQRYHGRRPDKDGYRYALGDGDGQRWRVYDRAGEPCDRCAAAIRRVVQGGRSTYYCGGCQRI
jgi:formamidopyrimidine-DNA glycosylase